MAARGGRREAGVGGAARSGSRSLPDLGQYGRLAEYNRKRHFGVTPEPPGAPGPRSPGILLVVLILLLIGALPTWGHSRSWGYMPSGGLGLIVIILLILVLTGRL